MAYLPMTDEEKKREEQQEQGGDNLVISGPESSQVQSEGGQPKGPQQKQKGSGFQGIADYLNLNRPQADQLTSTMANTEKGKIQQLDSSITPAMETVINEAKSNAVQYDPDVMGKMLEDPTKANKADFDKYYKAEYKGPTSVNVKPFEDQYNTLDENINLAGSEQGRNQLVKNTYGRPTYSAGENKLDSALMGNAIGEKYAGLKEILTPVKSTIDQWNQKAQSEIKSAQEATIAAKQKARNDTETAMKAWSTLQDDRVANAKNNADKSYTQAISQGEKLLKAHTPVNTGGIMGVVQRSIPQLYLPSANAYISGGDFKSSLSEEEIAKMNALYQLAEMVAPAVQSVQNPYNLDSNYEKLLSDMKRDYDNKVYDAYLKRKQNMIYAS